MKEFLNNINKEVYTSVIVIFIAIITYIIVKNIINKILKMDSKKSKLEKKKKTVIKLFNSIFRYVFIGIAVVIILQINGVNVTSIIAGLGLVSVIAGLALQDALKDIIMGFNIVIDDYYSVGDIIKINGIEGKVIEVGLKVTKLVDVANGNKYVISNRNIAEALTVSNEMYMDVPLRYEEKIEDVEKLFEEIVKEILKIENIIDARYIGLSEFDDSAIKYKLKILVKPEFKLPTKRAINRIIKLELEKRNIEIPYTQIDVHTKK